MIHIAIIQGPLPLGSGANYRMVCLCGKKCKIAVIKRKLAFRVRDNHIAAHIPFTGDPFEGLAP